MSRRPRREGEARTAPRRSRGSSAISRPPALAATIGQFVRGRKPLLALAGVFFSVLLVIFGIVTLRSNSLSVGSGALILGLLLFIIISRNVGAFTLSKKDLTELATVWLPSALPVLALFLAALSAHQVTLPQTPAVSTTAEALWISAILCMAVGVLWLEHWIPSLALLPSWFQRNWRELLLVLVILVLGLAARLYLLDQHPYPWSYDEATIGLEGQRVLNPGTTNWFDAGWSGNPNLAFAPAALSVAILGNSILALRGISALTGILAMLFLYLLARELFGRSVALLSTAFLISFPYHLQFSRLGVLTVQDSLLVTLTLWLVVRAVRSDRLSGYLCAGLATGLNLYAYVGGRWVIALAVAALALVSIRTKGYFGAHARHLAVYLAAALITLAPMSVFFLDHPQIFNSRLGQVGIIQSGWLAGELRAPGKTVGSILLDQFARSTLVYIGSGAYGTFFNSPQPYLTLLGSVLFLIGMVVAFQQLLKVEFAILLTWFWSVVILGGVMTVSPPANTRLVMTIPALALFVALGLTKLGEILSYLRVPRTWQAAAGGVVIGFLMVQNAAFYFGPYRAGHYLDDANAEVSMTAGTELQKLGPPFSLYMLGLPRMSARFPTIPFLTPANPRLDLDAPQASTVDLAGHFPAFIVATPDNEAALRVLAQRYPGGKWETVASQSRNEPLYYAYILNSPGAQTTP